METVIHERKQFKYMPSQLSLKDQFWVDMRAFERDHGIETIIFTHGDSDGICSGAIAKSAYPDSQVYFTSPVSLLQKLELAKGYRRVIICDIAIDERTSAELLQRLKEVAQESDLIYIDHHPVPENGWTESWLHNDPCACSSELTYKVLAKRLNRDVRRVAIYGAIGDYADDTDSVKQWCEDWDKRTLFFEAGALIQAVIYSGREFDFKRVLVEHLAKDRIPSSIPDVLVFAKKCSELEEQLRLRIKKQVKSLQNIAYVIDPKGYKSKSAIYAAAYGQRKVGASAEYRQTKHAYDVSFRSRSPVDLNLILRDVAPRFGGTGGGLAEAAGARIPVANFKAFLNDLDTSIGEEEHRLKEEHIIDKCH